MAANWDAPNTERLRTLWDAGHTAQEIAEMFGDGRTRNAIIGKAHNLELPGRPRGPKAKHERSGQMLGKGYRKAYASRGDDMRARFVRVSEADRGPRKRRQNRPRLPGFESPFIQESRTKFSKAVQAPTKDILVSGYNNIKIGKVVTARFFKGYWIYTLSLEERKTCPSSCKHWQTCYGNNMPFAKRVDHTATDFLEILEKAVVKLCAPRKPGRGGTVKRKGVLIRLHALGDFFSVPYVQFWARMLHEHPTLSIYGYTARKPVYPGGLGIGDAIQEMNAVFLGRSMIRFSDGGMSEMSTVSIGNPDSCPKDAFICPEQTGKSVGCDACGACWGTRKNVAFLEH